MYVDIYIYVYVLNILQVQAIREAYPFWRDRYYLKAPQTINKEFAWENMLQIENLVTELQVADFETLAMKCIFDACLMMWLQRLLCQRDHNNDYGICRVHFERQTISNIKLPCWVVDHGHQEIPSIRSSKCR